MHDELTHAKSTAQWQSLYHEAEQRLAARTAELAALRAQMQAEIATRQQAETALQANDARFAALINSAMDAIISVDEELRVVLFNTAAELMFGYTRAEMLGAPLDTLIPTRFHHDHTQHLRRFGAMRTTARSMGALGAISGVRKNGEEFPLEASISQFETNGQKLYTVILRDITRRKASEERLREQAALLNHAREAIATCDLQGRILFWNQGAERLYGWRAEEVIGRDLRAEIYGVKQAQQQWKQPALFEQGEWRGEMRQFTKDGREITVECHWVLVRDDAGQPKLILIINNDATEKKQLEAQFLRAQRMESIGTLAGGIAHDLNNILSPISMGLQMLQIKLADEYSQKLLGMMSTNVERGAAMVKQILQFARGVSGERIPVQIKHLVKELLKLLAETFPKSIVLKQQLTEEPALVLGDATQLHQVLLNLCVNARDAMPEGGTLTLSLANEQLSAAATPNTRAGDYVVLSVADTGFGIAPEHLDRIFDPFFTTKAPGQGTGLGLSTVFGIVRAHSGFVTVESQAGQGTTFKVYLPAVVQASLQPAVAAQRQLPLGRGEWLLLVDDEAAIREMCRAVLEAHGYHVLAASDGAAALALYAQHQDEVRLVLTDLMMPVLDGAALLRALRKLNPQLPVVCCSGTAGAADEAELAQLGVRRMLAKPLNVETLLTAVAEVLRDR